MGKEKIDNKRVNYIDAVKGISILAIVFGHIQMVTPSCRLLPFYFTIYHWHVGIFFVMSGMFISDRKIIDDIVSFAKKRIASLYFLSLFFYIPAVLLHNVLILVGWYTEIDGVVIEQWGASEYVINIVKVLLCMGREPIVGPLWFVYVLLFALIGYSILTWTIAKLQLDMRWKSFIILLLATISFILTKKYGIMMPRLSNVFPAMLLIEVGRYIYQEKKWSFNNLFFALVSVVLLCEIGLVHEGAILNKNIFSDIVVLTVSCVMALYFLAYIAQIISNTVIGHFLMYCGKNSFYIMALHLVGFKVCTILCNTPLSLSDLTPDVGTHYHLILLYIIFGLAVSLLPKYVYDVVKKNLKE